MMNVRKNFDKNLQQLQNKMMEMNALTVSAFEKAFTAFKTQDVELALRVIDEDTAIDNLDQEINQLAVWLIAKEQPFATDLRRIIASLKITSDIERIADFAVNIAKATAKIGKTESLINITSLEKMNEVSLDMLKKAVTAFIDGNMELAKEVAALDDQVDDAYAVTYKSITEYLRTHPEETTQLVQLLFINRFLERTADHITNIAESAAYLIKGQIYDLNQ
ncbi:phosphate signaling complex protein PhoU [Sporosarcina thermotolerans]|uniref:Phosphate-specific transport system accessory protein PhoU n=1 Tax=Sporosarcina thermotolerans TaxID=633404 RepID=A0AAW9A8Z7_9BACL|nr:phosphate signaling complex protein PhoU [Sporosarcina thermotolerans]MDW0117887.1 phosphate signaling complex protein PhoU [Sporosarcina thermotolerans]WHT49310.1 phosphate signaling complex protein PhoU [Sporosarcina thermotolerans]